MNNARELGLRAAAMLDELAAISAEDGRLVRLFLTPEHRRAADLVAGWVRRAGLRVSEDALGTVRGHLGSGARPRLLLGSHIDTVIDAGRFDGALGVVAAVLTAEYCAAHRRDLPFDLEVLAFGDEEGSRFPATLTSSSAAAGIFDPAALSSVDPSGTTLEKALQAYGKNPANIGLSACEPGTACAYVEVHIEQGPVLEDAQQPLGVVTGIVGQSRMLVTLIGTAGHAGTVPMATRRDALAGASELVLALERIARDHPSKAVVATVGRIEATPNVGNVIAASATFSIDIRSVDDDAHEDALEQFRRELDAVATRRGLEVAAVPFLRTNATPCSAPLQTALAASVRRLGFDPVALASGAGHDAGVMARLCPAAMLFVRCRGGVSHSPAEYASPEDIGLAIAALIDFIEHFNPQAHADSMRPA